MVWSFSQLEPSQAAPAPGATDTILLEQHLVVGALAVARGHRSQGDHLQRSSCSGRRPSLVTSSSPNHGQRRAGQHGHRGRRRGRFRRGLAEVAALAELQLRRRLGKKVLVLMLLL